MPFGLGAQLMQRGGASGARPMGMVRPADMEAFLCERYDLAGDPPRARRGASPARSTSTTTPSSQEMGELLAALRSMTGHEVVKAIKSSITSVQTVAQARAHPTSLTDWDRMNAGLEFQRITNGRSVGRIDTRHMTLASSRGRAYRNKFQGDPWLACRELDIDVAWGYIEPSVRKGLGLSDSAVGFHDRPTGSIVICDASCSVATATAILAHELGHNAMHSAAAGSWDPGMGDFMAGLIQFPTVFQTHIEEEQADGFARAFLGC